MPPLAKLFTLHVKGELQLIPTGKLEIVPEPGPVEVTVKAGAPTTTLIGLPL